MADLNTTLGLSDREFKRGLRDVRRDVSRTRGEIHRESGAMGDSVARVTRRFAMAYVTIGTMKTAVRGAVQAGMEYRQQNSYLDDSLRSLDTTAQRLKVSLGRDMALSIAAAAPAIDEVTRAYLRMNGAASSFVADLFAGRGHSDEVLGSMRTLEEQDRAERRRVDGLSRRDRAAEEELTLSGDSYGAQRVAAERELRERQIDINRRELEGRRTDPAYSLNDERDAADRIHAARLAALERQREDRVGSYRDRFDAMRADRLEQTGQRGAADRLREESEVRRFAHEVARDELLTEEERNRLIAEGTRLIREQYRTRTQSRGEGVDAGVGFLAPQTFGRGSPTRHELLSEDPRGRRVHQRLVRRAAMLDRTGGTDRRAYDLADPAVRASREAIDATYAGTGVSQAPVLASAAQRQQGPVEVKSASLDEIRKHLADAVRHLEKLVF